MSQPLHMRFQVVLPIHPVAGGAVPTHRGDPATHAADADAANSTDAAGRDLEDLEEMGDPGNHPLENSPLVRLQDLWSFRTLFSKKDLWSLRFELFFCLKHLPNDVSDVRRCDRPWIHGIFWTSCRVIPWTQELWLVNGSNDPYPHPMEIPIWLSGFWRWENPRKLMAVIELLWFDGDGY